MHLPKYSGKTNRAYTSYTGVITKFPWTKNQRTKRAASARPAFSFLLLLLGKFFLPANNTSTLQISQLRTIQPIIDRWWIRLRLVGDGARKKREKKKGQRWGGGAALSCFLFQTAPSCYLGLRNIKILPFRRLLNQNITGTPIQPGIKLASSSTVFLSDLLSVVLRQAPKGRN